MLSQRDLEDEVSQEIVDAIARDNIASAGWVTQAIVARHDLIEGDDVEWYRLCAFGHVRDAVRRCLRRYQPSPTNDPDPQLTLEGFARVQKAYLVERDGDQVVIPTAQLDGGELTAKIAELRGMASGCLKHANELERYRDERIAA